MNIHEYVVDLDLRHEETKRTNCPACGGYKTFTASNNMGALLWNCYKASCAVGGKSRIRMSIADLQRVANKCHTNNSTGNEEKFVPPMYWKVSDFPPQMLRHCVSYGFDADSMDLYYDAKEDRVVYPIYDKHGHLVDAAGKALSKRLPKWKRYAKSGVPYTHSIATGDKLSTVVVVEDCISAGVVGNLGLVGLALLGTSLLDVHKKVIAQYEQAIIALDRDALPKLIEMAKELRAYVGTVKIMRLNDDIKYAHPDDVKYLIEMKEP
jgi:hypothetical protein